MIDEITERFSDGIFKTEIESKQRKLAPITFDTGGEKLIQMSNSAKIF